MKTRKRGGGIFRSVGNFFTRSKKVVPATPNMDPPTHKPSTPNMDPPTHKPSTPIVNPPTPLLDTNISLRMYKYIDTHREYIDMIKNDISQISYTIHKETYINRLIKLYAIGYLQKMSADTITLSLEDNAYVTLLIKKYENELINICIKFNTANRMKLNGCNPKSRMNKISEKIQLLKPLPWSRFLMYKEEKERLMR